MRRLVLDGQTLSEAYVRARAIADAEGFSFIHPYDDPIIVAGAGTAAARNA
ncbi:MAG: hypothetical protein WDM89_03525 [Rhizomicrobium sp.]